MRNLKSPFFDKGLLILFISLCSMLISQKKTYAQDQKLVVRMAKLTIDSAQLESYKAFLKEEIETSIRVEPGVLTLNAVSEKNDPTEITIIEVYASQAAYLSHLETPHFLKYKNGTSEMVISLRLVEVDPIALGSKKE